MAGVIKWSKHADRKFDIILEYLNNNWGETAAKAFVKKTYEFLDLVADYPQIGSIENAERCIRGFVLIKQITVFYKINEDNIVILNFYDNRQKPKRRRYSKRTH